MAMQFLKKTACGTAVFLCLLSIGNTSMSFDCQPASTVHSEEVDIIGMDTTDLLGGLLISPLAARPENVEYLTPLKVPRPTPSRARRVTAGWYGPRHHNKRAANGQRFNMHKNTLAHRTLPSGPGSDLSTSIMERPQKVLSMTGDPISETGIWMSPMRWPSNSALSRKGP